MVDEPSMHPDHAPPQPPGTDPDARRRQEAIERVFVEAVATPPGERIAHIERSELDETAKREVIDLLRFHVAEDSTPRDGDRGAQDGLASLVGRSVAGCRLERLLGRGGMGAVFEATQSAPARRVAVKLLRNEFPSASSVRRFQLEAELMSRLEHPGIARVYAAGMHREEAVETVLGTMIVPYLVMEFIEGARPVTQFVSDARLSPAETVRLFAAVVDAVAYGHARGVMHRDLKPANILVGADGRPRIIDFGVAKAIDPDERAGPAAPGATGTAAFVGTLQYMSPEQCGATRGGADARSDIYALGLVLYELLAGRLPYRIPGDAGLVAAARTVHEAQAPALGSIDRRLKGDLERIAAKALAKDPGQRYQSANELAADLRRHLAHEPVLAREPTVGYRVSRFVRRNPALVATFTVATVALASVALVAVRFALDARHQRDVAATRSAQYAIEVGDFPAAREALAQVPADARGFEWGALWSRAAGWSHEVSLGAERPELALTNIYDIEAVRGGEAFAFCQGDTVGVIDARSGRLLSSVRDRRDGALTESLSFDVDAEARRAVRGGMNLAPIALALDDGRIVWRGPTPKELFAAVAIAPDGTRVAYANPEEPLRTVRIGPTPDAATPLAERALEGFIRSLDWSPDGSLLAVGIVPSTLLVLDAETLATRWSAALDGREDVPDVRFSLDGRFVTATAFAGRPQAFTRDGDAVGGVAPATLDGVASYAGELSPDGARIACGAMDQRPRVQDLADGRSFRLPGHEGQVWSVAWGAQGTVLATTEKSVRLWTLARHDPAGVAIAATESRGLRLSPDGSIAATLGGAAAGLSGDPEVLVSETATLQPLLRIPGGAQRLALDGVRRRIAVWNGVLSVYALDSATNPVPLWSMAPSGIAEMGLADADSGQPRIDALEWFADGRLAASAGNERVVAIEGDTGLALASLDFRAAIEANPVITEPSPIQSLRPFGATGIVGASSLPPGCFRWSGRAGDQAVPADSGVPGAAAYRRLGVAAEGNLIATGDVDGAVRMIDAGSMRERWRTDALTATCRLLAIRPQLDRVAAASIDRRVAILDAHTGEVLVRLPLPAAPSDLRFTPDGARLVIGLANGRILTLDDARRAP